MTRARDNADLGDSYGVLGAGVTGGSGLTALGTVTAGTFNGVLGDSYTQSSNYYLQGSINASVALNTASAVQIETDGSGNPRWDFVGDTTNLLPVNQYDIKFVKAGIYLVHFNLSMYFELATDSRYITGYIYGSGSTAASTTMIASSYAQVSNTANQNSDFGSADTLIVKQFAANDLINFAAQNSTSGGILYSHSRFNIVLLRPV